MMINVPTPAELQDIAERIGFSLSISEAKEFANIVQGMSGAYQEIASEPESPPRSIYPRRDLHHVDRCTDPHHAWYIKTSIKGRSEGLLAGKTVGIKDNILVAGLPLMNGTDFLQGYTPDSDATVVQRVLDAGGEIVGKTACEYLCLSGGSHTNKAGPSHNPRRRGYSSGGSSSGSAIAVALGECDIALGCDQAGSIRMPAAWSGIVGLKPTYGLVPYTGILQIATLIDHVGPMSRTVRDNALLLEAIAGQDGIDGRQRDVRTHRYSQLLDGGVEGLRIAVVEEGFGRPESEAASDTLVRDAAQEFDKLGAKVETVSVPMHRKGPAIWGVISSDGIAHHTVPGLGFGFGFDQHISHDALDWFKRMFSPETELSVTTRAILLTSHYIRSQTGMSLYAKALDLRHKLVAAYDNALTDHDLLLMPTMPMKAQPLPEAGASLGESLVRTSEMFGNTCPFDISYHPAISIPCGHVDGLPIGLMLVGRHFDEPTIYRAAFAYEQATR